MGDKERSFVETFGCTPVAGDPVARTKEQKRKPRRRMIAYASTGPHQGPWVRSREDVPGMLGSLAIFETYQHALRDAVGPHMVHRVEIFIEREPATPNSERGTW